MNKPPALIRLIEELKGEDIESDVETLRDSKVVIYPTDEAAADDDGITLSPHDCTVLLSSPSTVERMYEALGSPADASITLFDVTTNTKVLDALETNFVAVDEG